MQNPVYIITGTTRGLGKHIKGLLSSRDEKVISINRSDVDLSKPEIVATFLQTLRQKIKTEYRDCDVIFINNAATLGKIAPSCETTPLDIIQTIGTNFTSPLLFCNFLFSLDNQWKYFNITSGAARSKNKYLGLYSTTKLGLEEYLEFMKLEIKDTNCRGIYNYDPKIISTGMNQQLKKNSFFKNEKFEKSIPKDAKIVAEEFCNFIEKNLK
jgi:NAD(P)-dependent dehydrogenase (short-subunit alcohol dehydrogenase family)